MTINDVAYTSQSVNNYVNVQKLSLSATSNAFSASGVRDSRLAPGGTEGLSGRLG